MREAAAGATGAAPLGACSALPPSASCGAAAEDAGRQDTTAGKAVGSLCPGSKGAAQLVAHVQAQSKLLQQQLADAYFTRSQLTTSVNLLLAQSALGPCMGCTEEPPAQEPLAKAAGSCPSREALERQLADSLRQLSEAAAEREALSAQMEAVAVERDALRAQIVQLITLPPQMQAEDQLRGERLFLETLHALQQGLGGSAAEPAAGAVPGTVPPQPADEADAAPFARWFALNAADAELEEGDTAECLSDEYEAIAVLTAAHLLHKDAAGSLPAINTLRVEQEPEPECGEEAAVRSGICEPATGIPEPLQAVEHGAHLVLAQKPTHERQVVAAVVQDYALSESIMHMLSECRELGQLGYCQQAEAAPTDLPRLAEPSSGEGSLGSSLGGSLAADDGTREETLPGLEGAADLDTAKAEPVLRRSRSWHHAAGA